MMIADWMLVFVFSLFVLICTRYSFRESDLNNVDFNSEDYLWTIVFQFKQSNQKSIVRF